jgi:lipopolysaccharide/colanic/teichoic acid biosynthesis glycosyltransferase
MDYELPTPRIKRAFDILVSFILIVLGSWIFLLLILIYWITRNTPIFFYQPRIGKGGRVFTMVKFRTIDTNTGAPFAFGNFLRATTLDELPQLFQVLSGKLSMVGPRPLLTEYEKLYSAQQWRRHNVLPGITGWAQVNGRHAISWTRKFELDTWYVDHWSFGLDIWILIKTAGIVFSFKPDVSLKEDKFTGGE